MEPQRFSYQRPDNDRAKNLTPLCQTDRLWADMQLVKEGGENKLHSHTVSDGFFMVIQGAARFYGEGDVLLAELGAEPLQLLHVAASDPNLKDVRVGPSRE